MRQGILAAFDEVNRAGGINGRTLELLSIDDGYDPDRSVLAIKKLIDEDKVFAIVGPVGTPTSLATQPIATEAKVPFIGAFTGAEFLRRPFKENVVNIRASYFQEAEAMIERLTKDRGVSRIAILYQDDAFGRAGYEGVQRAMGKRNLQLVAEGSFERNTTAVKSALLTIRNADPQAAILIGPYKPCAAFIKLARALNMNALFLNTSFVGSEALAQELGVDGKGVIVTQVVPSPWDGSAPLVARYQAALRAVDARASFGFVSLEGYAVGRLVVTALAQMQGAPTRQGLLNEIFGHTFDLGGLVLRYGPKDNDGSDVVFLTRLNGDGATSLIQTLNDMFEPNPDFKLRLHQEARH